MNKLLKGVKFFITALSVYVAVFVFSAGIVFGENSISSWKSSESVIVAPQKVDITGLNRLTREIILLVTGLNKEKSWFDIDERELEKFIYSTGWVRKCTVKKTFPDSVRIVVEEFEPAIVVSSFKNKKDPDSGSYYTMWFADRTGFVFKKAFPGEMDDSLPFLHIERDVVPIHGEEKRMSIIKKAVILSDSLKKASEICSVKSVRYSSTNSFTADCENEKGMITTIHMENFEEQTEVAEMSSRFLNTAQKLRSKNIWAGEYIFEGTGNDRKIIVGKFVKRANRGSDA